jgi:hypothetical protein
MHDINEASHTFASYNFATYCEQVTKKKRGEYFTENFDPVSKEEAFGPHNGCCECEGTGWVPVYKSDMDNPYRKLWVQAEIDNPSADGWHLLPCKECQGVSDDLDQFISKSGSKFTLKSRKEGKDLGSFDVKEAEEKRIMKEASDRPDSHVDKTEREHEDKKKQADDSRNADPDKKQKSKEKFADKKKERESKKLLPYEFTSQKDATRAASHLGLNGAHSAGSGIYKPGSSEFALRDAVHQKKEKQRARGSKRFHESLDTGLGLAMVEPIITQIKRTMKKVGEN